MREKVVCYLLLVASGFSGYSQSDTFNRLDGDGLKYGYWIIKNDVKKLPDYKLESIVEEGNFALGKKTGVWKHYWPNGGLHTELTWEKGIVHGPAKMYYENGCINEEGYWENGRWIGNYKMYHPDSCGKIFYDFKYNKSGKREGQPSIYPNMGKVMMTGEMKDPKPEDTIRKREGLQIIYPENGTVIMTGEMKDGKEAGTWEEYYENGDLKKSGIQDTVQVKKNSGTGKVKLEREDSVIAGKKDLEALNSCDCNEIMKRDRTEGKDLVGPNKTIFNGSGFAKLYNLNKSLVYCGSFRNYKIIYGLQFSYDKNGVLVKIEKYMNAGVTGECKTN